MNRYQPYGGYDNNEGSGRRGPPPGGAGGGARYEAAGRGRGGGGGLGRGGGGAAGAGGGRYSEQHGDGAGSEHPYRGGPDRSTGPPHSAPLPPAASAYPAASSQSQTQAQYPPQDYTRAPGHPTYGGGPGYDARGPGPGPTGPPPPRPPPGYGGPAGYSAPPPGPPGGAYPSASTYGYPPVSAPPPPQTRPPQSLQPQPQQGYAPPNDSHSGYRGGPPPMSATSRQDYPSRGQDESSRGGANPQEGSKIEKRIARERPCRVLFVRNVKYNSDGAMLKKKFGVYGEMKSFFDLISTRGILFITYYDIRAAVAARDGMQGFDVECRPIDVHYSLPKDDESPNRHCDREKNQGTLRIVLHNGRVALQEYELDRMFRTFGAIKGIYFSGGDPAKERLLEFYDIRAMGDAYDRMQDKEYPGGGKLEVFYDWDVKDIPLTNPPVAPGQARQEPAGRPNPYGRDSPVPRTPQSGASRYPAPPQSYPPPSHQHQDERDQRPYDNRGGYPPQQYGGSGAPAPPPPARDSPYGQPPPQSGYGRPPQHYGGRPASPPVSASPRSHYPTHQAGAPAPAASDYPPGPPGTRYGQAPPVPPPHLQQSPPPHQNGYSQSAYGQPPPMSRPPPPPPPPQQQQPQSGPAPPGDISNLLATLGQLPQGGARPQQTSANGYGRSIPPPPANYQPTPPASASAHGPYGNAPATSAPPPLRNSASGPPLPGDLMALVGRTAQQTPAASHQRTPSYGTGPPGQGPGQSARPPGPPSPFPMPPSMPPAASNSAGQPGGQQQVNALLAMLKAQQQ